MANLPASRHHDSLTRVRELDAASIQTVRAFNRLVGERIGALNDEFLGRRRPMGESRVLWEVGPDGVEVRTLRVRLGLDSGYITRVLQSLQKNRLINLDTDLGG